MNAPWPLRGHPPEGGIILTHLTNLPPFRGEGGQAIQGYKNNNGNSSLGLVPIHRSQPRLFTMSDYCYSDRLRHWILDPFLQPWAFGLCLLQQNLLAVLFSRLATGIPGRSVIQALVLISRRILYQFQVTRGRSPSYSVALWLNLWKNVSVFRWLTEHSGREVRFVQASALLMRRPEGLTETDRVSFK